MQHLLPHPRPPSLGITIRRVSYFIVKNVRYLPKNGFIPIKTKMPSTDPNAWSPKTFALTRVMSTLVQKQSESSLSYRFVAYEWEASGERKFWHKILARLFRVVFSINVYFIVFLRSIN